MKSLTLALLFICTILAISCKKDVARNITGNYTGIVKQQDITGALISASLPIEATVSDAPGDSVILTIGSGSGIFFSQKLPVNNKSEFGYISAGGNQSYRGNIKGDSLFFLYANLQPPAEGRLVYEGRKK